MRRKSDKLGYLVGTTVLLAAGFVALCWWVIPLFLNGVHIIWSIAAVSLMALVFGLLIAMLWVLHQEYCS